MKSTSLFAFLCFGTLLFVSPASVLANEEVDVEVQDDADVQVADEAEEPEFEEEEYQDEEFSVMYAPSPDVSVSYYFPEYPDKKIPLGEEVTALIALNNAGDRVLNVSYVGAQLHSPYDLGYFIQNYTPKEIWATVLPQSEVTLEYKFTSDDSLEALEFWLSGYVFYNSSDNLFAYRHTWANSTIELTNAKRKFDGLTILTYFTILGIFGGIGYAVLVYSGAKKKMDKNRKKAANAAPAKETTDADWGIAAYKPASGSKKAGRKTGSFKASKDKKA